MLSVLEQRRTVWEDILEEEFVQTKAAAKAAPEAIKRLAADAKPVANFRLTRDVRLLLHDF